MSAPWLFDVGNTRLKCAPLAGVRAGPVHAITHERDAAVDAVAAALATALPTRMARAYVASVAGDAVTAGVLQALAIRTRQIVRVRTVATFESLRIAYADPARLGVDRFLALVAAHGLAEAGDVLVCGVGTALTVDLLDRDGLHHGGALAPSPTLMRDALHARVPALPVDGGAVVDFAADTADALATGCEDAALGAIERLQARALARLGRPVRVLLHGGGAAVLAARLPQASHAPDLVLAGLARWAARDVACVDG